MKRTELKRTGGIKSKRAKPRVSKAPLCKRRGCSRRVISTDQLCRYHVIDRCDSIVRHRAYELGACSVCGTDRDLQWSHHLSRRFMHIRWDERNYTVHCKGCHYRFTENPDLHTDWILREVGAKTFAWLRDQAFGPLDADGRRSGPPPFKTVHLLDWYERLATK